jgi:hypothetical protein
MHNIALLGARGILASYSSFEACVEQLSSAWLYAVKPQCTAILIALLVLATQEAVDDTPSV